MSLLAPIIFAVADALALAALSACANNAGLVASVGDVASVVRMRLRRVSDFINAWELDVLVSFGRCNVFPELFGYLGALIIAGMKVKPISKCGALPGCDCEIARPRILQLFKVVLSKGISRK